MSFNIFKETEEYPITLAKDLGTFLREYLPILRLVEEEVSDGWGEWGLSDSMRRFLDRATHLRSHYFDHKALRVGHFLILLETEMLQKYRAQLLDTYEDLAIDWFDLFRKNKGHICRANKLLTDDYITRMVQKRIQFVQTLIECLVEDEGKEDEVNKEDDVNDVNDVSEL